MLKETLPQPSSQSATTTAPASILSQTQLEDFAMRIAASHRLAESPRRGRPLLSRLDDSAEHLDAAYAYLSVAGRGDSQPVGSEEWLRDNHHVVQDQVREIRQDLPRRYYVQLPKLADGPFQGYPRVYVMARELISHTAGRIDLETVTDFTTAYQKASPLSIGETWAVPIMLRLALIEELRRLADGVVEARKSREKARRWQKAHPDPQDWTTRSITAVLDDARKRDGTVPPPFVLELLQWLRDQPSTAAPAWQALHRALQAQDDSVEEMLRLEHQQQAANQLAISNAIASMRRASDIDWTQFFERVNVVEQMLRQDPAGAYAAMDFATRDRYRHSIEQLATRAKRSEGAIALQAIELARAAIEADPGRDRQHHVGYYLISRGRFRLEREVGYRPRVRERMARFVFRHPAIGYLGLIAFTIAISVASFVIYATRHGASITGLWLVALIVLLPLSELVISLINLIITAQVPPRPLPKLAMRDGIPASARTMVVVPVIVESESRLDALLDDLEVRFLGNRDSNLHFALLADFPDAHEAEHAGDDAIVSRARQRINDLNARYGADRFFYFHRARRWNPGEQLWMGWERKRGKLSEFNRLLRGARDTSFAVCHGRLDLLPSVRHVITLDSDTQLPLESARRLVGTLTHPLNRPRFDERLRRVTEGYGILQPRVGVDVVSANRTAFAKVFSGHVGIDPYTTAVSDVYQDLFHEGSYVGKGIYDVDAFEAALENRVPEDTLLSHDLFEGFYARAGLCTDIHLIDDYPPHYLAFAARQHRWARGDWQIVRWLWRTVPDAARRPVRNTLPVLARWKILDNLRRSLLPIALVGLLTTGWTILPGSALVWTTLAILVLAFPAYVQVARSLSSRVSGVRVRDHIAAERDTLLTSARQSFLSATFLAHQAWLMADAIFRTLWRLVISHRHKLEWVSAYYVARVDPSPVRVARQMIAGPVLAVAIAILVAIVSPVRLWLALPLIALWIVSPVIAYGTGQALTEARQTLDEAGRIALRKVARKTWRFFEDLVGPADHWLAPDNLQEDRKDLVAHRTSPTNIGLQLIATLAASDLGYISVPGVVERLEPTFDSLLKLPRYRGHFFNWYDTVRLAPLAPAYISTVDSGNLAGYLLTLRTGLISAIAHTPLIDRSFLSGLDDAIRLFEDSIASALVRRGELRRTLTKELADLRGCLAQPPDEFHGWKVLVDQLSDRIAALAVLLHDVEDRGDAKSAGLPSLAEAGVWLERAGVAIAQRARDLERFAPWITNLGDARVALPRPNGAASLNDLIEWCSAALNAVPREADFRELRESLARSKAEAMDVVERATRLADLADDFTLEMEFGFLFDRERQLFSIGYSVTEGRLDASYYDTLASEARLASFVAIALGQISHEHWFKLGRSLTPTGGERALLSWSASMFEYLMPLLVMRAYPGTLLDETYRAVVDRQIEYGSQRGVPWGISESAYNVQDLELNYQYRAFGVPGLGLKRGLSDDLVVAPYATMLAASVAPSDVVRNLSRLTGEGAAGRYGYYESIDYTPDRVPAGKGAGVVIPAYMAHHQGMSLVALNNALNDQRMQQRFHMDPRIQAADLLLQERIPRLVPLKNPPLEVADHVPSPRATPPSVRRYTTPQTLSPRCHLLSNGSYAVMVTNAGGGYSRRQQIAMTRWREDVTKDDWGSFYYIRDRDTGQLWSAAYQPTRSEPDEYEVIFAADRAAFRRVDGEIETRTEIAVSPEDDAELRRISITNNGSRPRNLDVASYAEVVLAPGDADLAHPAFSNLFIETRAVPERDALICTRRPRTGGPRSYLIHVMSGRGQTGAARRYETDRARFIGRGGTLARPAALVDRQGFSNTVGAVLDPIVSLVQSIRVPPGATARIAFTTAYADTESDALRLVEKYQDRRAVARALALASTHSQIERRHLNLTLEETHLFQRLGGRLLSGDSRLRAADAIAENRLGQRELWKHGISGDIPIVLLRIANAEDSPLIGELLKAHEYLRLKGLTFDLVILNEHPASYLQELQHQLQQIVDTSPDQPWIDKPGGVFLRRADLMGPADQVLLRAAARAVMDAADGGLRNQLSRPQQHFDDPATEPAAKRAAAEGAAAPLRSHPLEFFNGLGGFADDGREYVISLDGPGAKLPPAPWTNVIASPQFGFACTETGCGFTWSINSHENRLTPWRNDPVSDQPGEAIFIRDEATGAFWSATPLPANERGPYRVRHGQGYSVFEHERNALASELTLFVAPDDPVKIFRLALKNTSSRRRRCSVTLYVEWVLGDTRSRTSPHVVTSQEPATGAVTAANVFRDDFGTRVAFVDLSPVQDRSVTGDRTEFIGRNGALADAAALHRDVLSSRTGPAMDPCGAVRVELDLGPFDEQVAIGLLGDAPDADRVRDLVERYRAKPVVDDALSRTKQTWNDLLGTVTVRTPDRAMDLMLNRWLLYQTLSCRIWGRSAFYQSSGAFGFRDQLQDTLALLLAAPEHPRKHLLHAASHQFLEGDVQHWWHEPGGQGVRTRFSDDRLWLVYATLEYIRATGDDSVLDETAPFLAARALAPEEHEVYDRPAVASESATLYEHCVRAIAVSLGTGAHALPLMGTGDWNDGMNLVGAAGKGESVWLGWFIASLLPSFADIAERRGDRDRADEYRRFAAALGPALDRAWDGDWYRRAYFDDGTPLGSKENSECRIDGIAQSWSVISGVGNPERARLAMSAVDQHLVRRDARLVLLLTPPFDQMTPSPGYIQGYLPGVRENGGQYTHAALWNMLAFARLGDGDRAAELFSLLNPLNHSATADDVNRYRVEPYVVAADVYSVPPHTGRGGWTWYTGSAGWMYRIGVEALLGISTRGNALHIDPCIPKNWPGYEIQFRRAGTTYRIVVENPSGVNRGVKLVELDGVPSSGQDIPIVNDGAEHAVRVLLG